MTIGSASAAAAGDVVLTASIGGVDWLDARVTVPAGANPVPVISDWVLRH